MSELLLYRAHKKVHPPTNLQYDYAKGHAVVLGGGRSHERGSVGTQARTSPPGNDAGAIEEGRYKATWETEHNTSQPATPASERGGNKLKKNKDFYEKTTPSFSTWP